ncbi:consortin [Pleurodeles waltl]|uniref:consortin n=1 Tax=Pleurodeles waltl TaxID=8319 RepID=UPI003709BF11
MKGEATVMDDREAHPGEMQSDALDAGALMQVAETLQLSIPDENENRLTGCPSEAATTVDGVVWLQEQVGEDSINNNESCDHSDGSKNQESSCREQDLTMPCTAEPMLRKGKHTSGKRSSRNKKGLNDDPRGFSSEEGTMLVPEDMSTDLVQQITLDGNVNHQLQEPQEHLQSLFALIKEDFEQNYVVSLPQCLHQIAETYFQEEEYEKAMQFIQLERLYHEQFLANLTAIQEEWETKWKKMVPEKTVPRSSENGLGSEELERLTQLCASHEEPTVFKRKRIVPEKTALFGTTEFGEQREKVAAACKSDRDSWIGVIPKRSSQERAVENSASPPSGSTVDSLTNDSRLRSASGQEQMDELYCSDESPLEAHTLSPGPVGRPRSDCLSCGDARNDTSSLLLDRVQVPEEVLPVIDSLDSDTGLHSEPKNGFSQTGRDSLRSEHYNDSTGSVAVFGQHLPGPGGEGSGRTPQDRTDPCGKGCNDKTFGRVCASLPQRVEQQPGDQLTEYSAENPTNADRNNTEISVESLECSLDDSESVPDEEVSYSPGEVVLEDSIISLDELAKRIEVEEIAPAEGLVSILKKQNESEGKKLAQMQQKQAKRRVRFQEMDDALDQEDLGGGSCFVLILLCAATVFLSIGGTALYCTFGYVESPVCTDFADNMDFYYSRLLQGMEELKHWFPFS